MEINNQVEVDSDDPEIGRGGGGGGGGGERCVCHCTCEYDRMTDSASNILESAASEKSLYDQSHPPTTLQSIKDDGGCREEFDEEDDDDSDSDSSVASSFDDRTSRNIIDLTRQSEPVPEPQDSPLKIPSIVITPVDPNLKLSSGSSDKTSPVAYSDLLQSEPGDQPYDSGKGSSDITSYTCQTNNITSPSSPSSSSSSSLSTNSSGVFSDCHYKNSESCSDPLYKNSTQSEPRFNESSHHPGKVYANGGFAPQLVPRIKRSRSEEVSSSSLVSVTLGAKGGLRRVSRSLTDLGFGATRPYRILSDDKLHNKSVESFSIHTKVFDEMMKS